MSHNNYRTRNLIGHYHVWVISPRNSTSFTRPFLAAKLIYTTTHTHTQCAFLIWCMVPIANNGSMIIYHRLIKPFVKEHEKDFEDAISAGTQLAKEAGKKGRHDKCISQSNTTSLCVGHPSLTNSLHPWRDTKP